MVETEEHTGEVYVICAVGAAVTVMVVVALTAAHLPHDGKLQVIVQIPGVLKLGVIDPVLEFNDKPVEDEKVPPVYVLEPTRLTD